MIIFHIGMLGYEPVTHHSHFYTNAFSKDAVSAQ